MRRPFTVAVCVAVWHLAGPDICGAQEVVITNARIIDGTGRTFESGSILLRDGLIQSVTEGGEASPATQVLDAAGMTVMPGLIDTHVHVLAYSFARSQEQLIDWTESTLPERLAQFLEAGVTTVLDNGDFYPAILDVRSRVDRGELLGPRMLVVGPVFTAPEGHPARTVCQGDAFCRQMLAVEAVSPDAARTRVASLAQAGVDGIKAVYHQPGFPALDDDVLMAIADEADDRGLPLLVHEASFEQARQALELGADRLVHVPWSDEVDRLVAREQLAAFGVLVSTTIGGTPRPLRPLNTRALSGEGVVLAFGTDAPPFAGYGPVLATEVEALAAVLSAEEIVATLTRNAAAYVGLGEEIGTLESGKQADILILGGDPLAELSNLGTVQVVLKGGQIVVDNR